MAAEISQATAEASIVSGIVYFPSEEEINSSLSDLSAFQGFENQKIVKMVAYIFANRHLPYKDIDSKITLIAYAISSCRPIKEAGIIHFPSKEKIASSIRVFPIGKDIVNKRIVKVIPDFFANQKFTERELRRRFYLIGNAMHKCSSGGFPHWTYCRLAYNSNLGIWIPSKVIE